MPTAVHHQLLGGLPCYPGAPNQIKMAVLRVAQITLAYKGLSAVHVLALASVDALPTAACAKIDMLIGECCLNQDVPPQPCEG